MSDTRREHSWPIRHVTKILIGVGVLLFVDSRTTNVVVAELDPEFDYAKENDTPSGWRAYVAAGGRPEKARVEIGRLHEGVRTHLRTAGAARPDGLDPWLTVLRERVDERIYAEAEPIAVDRDSFARLVLDPIPGAELVPVAELLAGSPSVCAYGLAKAFANATGSEAIDVEPPDAFEADTSPDAPRIHVRWAARANGEMYSGRTDKRVFPGIAVTASLELTAGGTTIATHESTVDPGTSFAFTTYGYAFGGADESEIVHAMLEAVCVRLGEQWIEELTGIAPAIASPDELAPLQEKCERGDAQSCLAHGNQERDSDPAAALASFEAGCRTLGLYAGDACVAAAELALEQPGEASQASAIVALDSGCRANHAVACMRAADLALSRYGESVPTDALGEAYVLRLRACDLGNASACTAAAIQAATTGTDGTPSPLRAHLLSARACAGGEVEACARADASREAAARERTVHGVALTDGDRVFDLRWGMWFEHEAAEIAWIESTATRSEIETRFAEPIATGRARVYDPSALPSGVKAATGIVVALAPAVRSPFGEPRRCPECTPDAFSTPFWPIACTCLPSP